MDKLTLSWIAGFWEGEGSVGCYFHKQERFGLIKRKINALNGRYILQVSVAQKEKYLIDYFKSCVSYGHIWQDKKSKVWIWRSCARQARDFLETIKPFIISPRRKSQIENATNIDSLKVKKWK